MNRRRSYTKARCNNCCATTRQEAVSWEPGPDHVARGFICLACYAVRCTELWDEASTSPELVRRWSRGTWEDPMITAYGDDR